jgi:hypothetical protein
MHVVTTKDMMLMLMLGLILSTMASAVVQTETWWGG